MSDWAQVAMAALSTAQTILLAYIARYAVKTTGRTNALLALEEKPPPKQRPR